MGFQCRICCYWEQMGILPPIPSRIHPACGCPGPVSMSDLLLGGADGGSAHHHHHPHPAGSTQSRALCQLGLPMCRSISGLLLVHGVDVHPDNISALSRQAMAAQGQFQCRICCYWEKMRILPPIPSRIPPACGCPGPVSMSDLLLVGAESQSAPTKSR